MPCYLRSCAALALSAALLGLSACSTAPTSSPVYVPPTRGTSATPKSPQAAPTPQPSTPATRKPAQPSYRGDREPLSAAAASLVREADQLYAQNKDREALNRLERAQRISPRAPEVYYQLARGYARQQQFGRAEQLALKGVSLAGSDSRMRQSGWLLVARIRQAAGNANGAAEARRQAEAQ